jgi:glycosyltransferase involved in cell wall biosynthesis
MYSLQAQMTLPGLVTGASLLHCPHYDIPALYDQPLSVTIHDVTHLIDPAFRDTLKSRVLARPMLKLAVWKARRIITTSQYSKRMIVEHLGGREDKISVIYQRASSEFFPMDSAEAAETVRARLGITKPYFLYVGNLKPHKNLPVLFEAYALLRSRQRCTPDLILIGKDASNESNLRRLAVQLGISGSVRWVSFVPDDLLRGCYSAAVATILPSRQEGFGLPVIESMACGTPVICSSAASLPEIAGQCALLFDPTSPEECCEKLQMVLDYPTARIQLRAQGMKRASEFAEKRTVEEHATVFKELLAS